MSLMTGVRRPTHQMQHVVSQVEIGVRVVLSHLVHQLVKLFRVAFETRNMISTDVFRLYNALLSRVRKILNGDINLAYL